MRQIRDFSEGIASTFRPQRIVLFGSHAHGTAGEDSDVDLLVVMPYRGSSARMAVRILDRLKPNIPVELLVRSPDQLKRRLAWNDFFLREIMDRGKVLYATDHRGMGGQSRR